MSKKIIALFTFLFLIFASPSYAFKPETFVSVVHLVNSDDITTLQNIKLAYQSSTPSAIFNDWLLTSQTIKSSTVSAYFQELLKKDKLQSVGLFIEPEEMPLDKMTVEKRKIEIDSQLNEYFKVFGNYPKFVSAPTMDTQSLNYLQKKYGILSFVFLPGQHPEIPSNVGGYLLAPFIASNKNFFLPSASTKDRSSVVVTEAHYLAQNSLIPNIEIASQKQFNEFTQITFWTNLSEEKEVYLKNLKQIYHQIKSVSDKYSLNQKSLADFSDWYLNRYPESTPAFYFRDGLDHIYQSPQYRLGLGQGDKQLLLKKLYIYPENLYDPSYSTENPGESGVFSIPTIDLYEFGNISLHDDLYFSRLKNFDYWKMSLKNEKEELVLDSQSITFKGINTPAVRNSFLKVENSDSQTTWTPIIRENKISFGTIVFLSIFVVGIAFILKKNKTKPPYFGLVLVVIASLISIRSGQVYPFGRGFWGPHGHDALFHLSLIQKFVNEPLNLSHPQISGLVISNYHLFFDYISALIISVFRLDIIDYYFIYFPLISGTLIVFLLDKLLENFKYTKLQKNLAFLLVFFGSSLGFLVRFFQNHDYLSGESAFWSNQSLSMFLNPPFILSLIILLFFLNRFHNRRSTIYDLFYLSLVGGILAQTKVYAFILLVLGLYLNRQLVLGTLVGVIGGLVSLPFSSLSGSPFAFNPLWFVRSMFESADRFYISSVASSWQVFEATGSFPKIFILSLIGLLIFVVGNFGVRLLGLIYILKTTPENNTDSLIRKIIFLSLLLPLTLTQSVNPWNSIQFLYYGLFFLGVYTVKMLPKNLVFMSLLMLVGIFGSVGTIRDYLTKNSSSRVSHIESIALSTLKGQTPGIVLSPLHGGRSVLSAPQPLYDYVSTSYISALTGKQEFLSDTINLDITGVDYNSKKVEVMRFYNTNDIVWAKQFLQKNNISYVYETPIKKLTISPSELGLESLFTSGEVNIYTVKGKLDQQ